ncbi:MAG: DUF397 domain-containing protein [Pseudonocardiaceae bacterium]
MTGTARPPRLVWCKSSRSHNGGNCVEVAGLTAGARAVRDSKNPNGPALIVTAGAWSAFTTGLRDSEFAAG